MKVSGLTVYPLHIKVMNFIESIQYMMCSNGHIMLSFLPVEFMDNINRTYVKNMLPRIERLNNVRLVIEQVLKPLAQKQLEAFSVRPRKNCKTAF